MDNPFKNTSDPFVALAKIGYKAYGDKADWKNYEGKPMPTWDELPQNIRDRWRSSAKAMKCTLEYFDWPAATESSP